ncbi:MAG: ABC transporter substrate-binding protein [Bacteriovoracaceae bacterium]|nr:ABC transporter substrate-binding protein [Bacteriovoracaceae bacterium]
MKKFIAIISIMLLGTAFAVNPKLPAEIKWETNSKDKVFASPDAKRGGTLREFMMSFPMTLRSVGPDSNGAFRSYLDANKMGLIDLHPETLNWTPALATHWAVGKDFKTVYFKLNKSARWSDGKPVTAKDFAYTLEFMRSKWIYAPWYNNYYSEQIKEVIIYDDHTFAVVGGKKKSRFEALYSYAISATPEHHFRPILNKEWTKKHNWDIVPNTGAYQIVKIKKGKSVTFKRVKDWWASDLKYYKNRYNYNKRRINVIRDMNMAFEHFKKGKIDTFGLVLPTYWHKKARGKEFDRGYINKIWYYNQNPQPQYGIWLNNQKWPFADINVRKGFAHAMNMDKLIKMVLRGDYERLERFSAGTGKYENKKIRARRFDLKKVKSYMTKAGWARDKETGLWKDSKTGKLFIVEVLYGSAPHTERLVVLKEEALKAGIKLDLKMLDGAASFKTMLEKQHQVAWLGMGAGMIPRYWQYFHSDNAKKQTNNFTNTNDKELDKLIMSYRNEFSDKKKHKLSQKIQQKIHDLGEFIPTTAVPYFRQGYWSWMKFPKVLGKRFGGITDYGVAWIDQDLKKKVMKMKKRGRPYKKAQTIINKEFKAK